MRPPRRPPHSKKSLCYFIESIFIITISICIILLVIGIAGVFLFGVSERLYIMANNTVLASECVDGGIFSAHLSVYSFFVLLFIWLIYGKIINPKFKKDH